MSKLCDLSTPSSLLIESWPSGNVTNTLIPPDHKRVTIGKNNSKGHKFEGAANIWSPKEQLKKQAKRLFLLSEIQMPNMYLTHLRVKQFHKARTNLISAQQKSFLFFSFFQIGCGAIGITIIFYLLSLPPPVASNLSSTELPE